MADPYVQAGLDAGLPPELAAYMPRYVQVESDFKPNAKTGKYTGLLQMGPDEIQRYGGNGLQHGASMYADNAKWFQAQYGRQPTPTELYMVAQQGRGGITNHINNPDTPAWTNMANTGEGRSMRDPAAWGKTTIVGNGGNVNQSSQQYLDMWRNKIEGRPIPNGSQYASSAVAPPLAAGNAPASPSDPAPQTDGSPGTDPNPLAKSLATVMQQQPLQHAEFAPLQPIRRPPMGQMQAQMLRNMMAQGMMNDQGQS
jgi:hypothetical protein